MSLYPSYQTQHGENTFRRQTIHGKDIFQYRPHVIKCEVDYSGTWFDITTDLISLNIRRAGFLFIPRANFSINNEDGYFTKGSFKISLDQRVRLKAKLWNKWWQLIDGTVQNINESPRSRNKAGER